MLTNNWKKSSRSNSQGGACVEARAHEGVAQVRDTKLGESSPILEASAADWTAFLAVAKRLVRLQDRRPPRHRGPFGVSGVSARCGRWSGWCTRGFR
ncbi:DUF397 domain-containing protein [Glycomyces dulcitolivorans]|uniref:DUF397 domain-containing protein n=1 Tax=Glycomyces dulcitolivorans TaxID=2200759 RepID=UPI000DD4CA75|nr:DUF397 domain-containing protein [Glycomyces dulcitolivorans]